MKLVLVYPMWPETFPAEDRLSSGLTQLGLRYLLANLPSHVEWTLLDCRKMNRKQFADALRAANPDTVGFYCATYLLEAAREAARIASEVVPNARRIVGGIHVSVAPEDFADDLLWHLGFVGQAEMTLAQYCDEPDKYRDRRLLVADEGKQGPLIYPDLLQHPYRFPGESEPTLVPDLPQPGHSIMIARGCPYRCKFCAPSEAIHFGVKIRCRSVANVMQEVEQLRSRPPGLGTLLIHDDCFSHNPKYVEQFCDAIKDMGIAWTCQCAVRDVVKSPHLPEIMAKAGCKVVVIGFESGSDRILALMDKGVTGEDGTTAAMLFHEAQIKIWGNYILGLPTETRVDMLKTEEFLRMALVDYRSPAVFTPHPGSYWGEEFCADRIGTTTESGERYAAGAKVTWQDPALINEFIHRCQNP